MQTVPGVPAMLHNCQVLQNEMVHFVTNLQHYIMFEVRSGSQFAMDKVGSIALHIFHFLLRRCCKPLGSNLPNDCPRNQI